MNKVCENCQKEYGAERATSRYCSSKCRKLAFQNREKVSVPAENSVSVPLKSDVSVSEKPILSVTITQENPGQAWATKLNEPGRKTCAGCGDDVGALTCICYQCIAKGYTHRSLKLDCHFKGWIWQDNPDGTINYPLSEAKTKQAILDMLHKIPSKELHEAGYSVPKWKQHFSSKKEALESLDKTMDNVGMQKDHRGIYVPDGKDTIDYSTWK